MVRIILPRRAGKTTSLVKLAKEHGYILVEPTKKCAVDVQKTHGVPVISAYEFLTVSTWKRDKYLVDELDWFLENIGIVGYSNTDSDCEVGN